MHERRSPLLLLSADMPSADINSAAGTDELASPLVSRLAVWERTPDGLTERAEVLRLSSVILPIPYEVCDLDGDGSLDVASYERGAPVGYMNDGAFTFTRRVLGETAPEYDNPLAMAYCADRNRDGAPDLLVATGKELEISVFVILGDGAGRFGAPGPATIVEAPLVPHGPNGVGFWFADVTADGIEDVVTQDAQSSDETPVLNLFASQSETSLAPAVQLEGLGFEFGDVDEDGATDIVTTRDGRLVALLARGAGLDDGDARFDVRELGISGARPVKDFALEHGQDREPVLHVLYDLSGCPACASGCSGRCIFDTCVACLSDADCTTGRCEDQACVRE